MKVHERAEQIWTVLSCAAQNRQVLTYRMVGDQIGVTARSLGRFLYPIHLYCVVNKLPSLITLVVSPSSGLPSVCFNAAADIPQEQEKVFSNNWLEKPTPSLRFMYTTEIELNLPEPPPEPPIQGSNLAPTPEESEKAVKERPSGGIPKAAEIAEKIFNHAKEVFISPLSTVDTGLRLKAFER